MNRTITHTRVFQFKMGTETLYYAHEISDLEDGFRHRLSQLDSKGNLLRSGEWSGYTTFAALDNIRACIPEYTSEFPEAFFVTPGSLIRERKN